MKSIQAQGKNVQKAIENGLKELNVTQDDVSIKIIDEGGLFRKAKVELILDKEIEEKIVKKEEKESTLEAKKEEKNIEEKQTKKVEKSVEKLDQKAEEKTEDKTEKVEEKEEQKTKKEKCDIAVNTQDVETFGKEFLKKLFEKMNIEADVESFKSEAGIMFNASGEKVSNLIGKRGETLNAIQEILSNVLKNAGYRDFKCFFDVENYKNRREMSLISLAERMAAKALKISKPIKLERMSAYERKIVHTALQNVEGVTSKSEGEEPNRRLVIFPTKKD